NTLLSKLSETDYCKDSEVMQPLNQLMLSFADYPQILLNTEKLIEDCNFEFEFSTPKNKKNYTENKQSDKELLNNLAQEGLIKRYGLMHEEARIRLERELKVIDELNFSAYFLITWDIVQYSMNEGLMH